MKIPYSRVYPHGDYLFAARGGKIHSFNLSSHTHVSTWKHPDTEKAAEVTVENVVATEDVEEDLDMDATPAEDEPPAKRQRLDENGDAKATEDAAEDASEDAAQGPKDGKKKGKKAKNRARGGESHRAPQSVDKPLVALITSTEDGKHVVAVSGHDKTMWVFEHDGEGNLNQISQRKMPKRPIDIFIGPDDTIVSADKFGDVYSLPLLFTPKSPSHPSETSAAAKKTRAKPSATALTVHSVRNRKALEAQLQQYDAQNRDDGGEKGPKAEEPTFDMNLLLGHVSMLTALALAENEGRKYIITADRDEHVRVSRYIPQAHVIEGFCLGHKNFIAAMSLPAGRGDILISGGGDSELFMWDWKSSTQLSSTSVLSLAQIVAPETTKVVVTGLTSLIHSSDSGDVTYVLAICQDIKAIFAWQLTEDNKLNHPSIIQIPGNPLHVTVASSPPRIIAAIEPDDNPAAKSLNVYTLAVNEGRLSSDECTSVDDEALTAAEADITEKELRSWLYTTEQLRKQEFVDPEEGADGAEELLEGDVEAAPEDTQS